MNRTRLALPTPLTWTWSPVGRLYNRALPDAAPPDAGVAAVPPVARGGSAVAAPANSPMTSGAAAAAAMIPLPRT
jgi:hypothetical protein